MINSITKKLNYEDLEKVPKIVKDIVNHLFKEKMNFLQFIQNYDPEE